MKSLPVFLCLAVTVLFAGCARMKISSECDPAYDFSSITTYRWIEPPEDILEKKESHRDVALQQVLNNRLSSLGWKQVLLSDDASVQVCYHVRITAHAEYTETSPPQERHFSGGLTRDRDSGKWSHEEREPDRIVYEKETGSLFFMMFDPSSGECIWQGMVVAAIDRSLEENERDKQYQRFGDALLKELKRSAYP